MTDFDKYIIPGEPDKSEKARIWQTAIGLQDVDGLKPSGYLLKTAEKHIEGDITIDQVRDIIDTYYESKGIRQDGEREGEMEADKVSVRITEILSEKVFSFTPDYLVSIHRRLFDGVFSHAGQFRTKNMIKHEWILDGDTVEYSPFDLIEDTLNYEFSQEKGMDYPSMPADEALKRICRFVSGIWQVHPFAEGNTRTTAVFAMKYLQNFGFGVDNTVFKDHSWYFRNALVRNNYRNYSKGISATTAYLELFFRNLLFGEQNRLSNRVMHVANSQSIISKSHNDALGCTLVEMSILKFLKDHPEAKQEDIAAHIGKSVSTVKRITPELVKKGLLERENGKRNGHWIVKLETLN